jgi:outer membrane immunogenic protein
MKRVVVAASAALAVSPGHAADLYIPPPVVLPSAPVPAAGCAPSAHAGLNAGYLWGGFASEQGIFDSLPAAGVLGGVVAGLDCTTDPFFFGIEADLSGILSAKASDTATFDGSEGLAVVDYSFLNIATLRARAGLWLNDSFRVYATAGLAFGNIGRSLDATHGNASPFTDVTSFWKPGWTAGIGAEFAFDRNWLGNVQVLHVDLGEDSFTAPLPGFGTQRTSITAQIFTAGIRYQF